MLGFIKSSRCVQSIPNKLEVNKNISVSVFEQASKIDVTNWNVVLQDHHLFLSIPYIQALENVLPKSIKPIYVIVYENYEPRFISFFHLLSFSNEQLKVLQKKIKYKISIKENAKNVLNNLLLSYVKCNKTKLLVLGNVLLTGDYSFISTIEKNNIFYIEQAISAVRKSINIDGVILKDNTEKQINVEGIIAKNYLAFYTQPNMVLTLPTDWNNNVDYINAFASKYKKRAKNAFSKFVDIETKKLTLQEIIEKEQLMFELYKEVYENNDYKLEQIPGNYFSEFKKNLPLNFEIVGYFLQDNLVAFASYFIDNGKMEANYIGFKHSLNKEYKLYQNMLYNYVEWCILNKCTTLSLSRTGLEIKSTVGAEPVFFNNHITFQNKLIQKIVQPILKNIVPEPFVQRHPFEK
jgi:hypothetical protein